MSLTIIFFTFKLDEWFMPLSVFSFFLYNYFFSILLTFVVTQSVTFFNGSDRHIYRDVS